MGIFDLLSLIFENLNRRKARVALTAIGVVIGTAAVVLLVSLGVGLQQNAASQLGGIGDLTQIFVYPSFDGGLEGGGGGGGSIPGGEKPIKTNISNSSLEELAGIPHVAAVVPQDYFQGNAVISYKRLEAYSQIIGVGSENLTNLGLKPQQGTLELQPGTILIGYTVPQNFYDPRLRPGQEPPPPPELMGETVVLTLIKFSADGLEVRKTVRLKVAGIIAESKAESDWAMYVSMKDIESWNSWTAGKPIDRNKTGYPTVLVRADSVENVLDVTDQITALGYQAFTPQSFVQGINGFYVVLQVIFGGVGAIALLVAAIGIANTMAMAILERTREIGLMKAVGATNQQVLTVFLGEAAGIGFIGGLGGVGIGWGLSQVLNVLAMAYLAGQAAETGGPPPTVAVSTPVWLPLFSLVFATFVGLLSGLYPALSAATLAPVKALKYE